MLRFKHAFLCIAAGCVGWTSFGQDKREYTVRTIAFYNVENLFDTTRDSRIWDAAWTPYGKNNWTQERYEEKVRDISEVIADIGRDNSGTTPDIIGLAEVENRDVLETLANHPVLLQSDYGIVHYDSPDRRGIDVAFLYKKQIFTPTSHKVYPLLLVDEKTPSKLYPTRDQLVIGGFLDGEMFHFIVVHWPSRYGNPKTNRQARMDAAALSRHIADSVLTHFPTSKLMILGDFNDNPTDKSIKKSLNTSKNRILDDAKALYNPMEGMFKKGMGTTAFRDTWGLFDQILISKPLTDTTDYTNYRFYRAAIYNKKHLQFKQGRYKGYPFRTFLDGTYTGGYSDHFPVYVQIIRVATP